MSSINSLRPEDRTPSELEESEGVRTEMTSLWEVDGAIEGANDEGAESESEIQFNGSHSTYAKTTFTRGGPHLLIRIIGGGGEDESIDINASTRSLMERYLDYRELHGRRYCGEYFMPNDELEQTRLYFLHQIFLDIFDGQPTTAPLNNPTKIIDIGTGTGDWAILMGEMYPECEIIGTDISAIQPKCPPINVFFEVEDAELPWLRHPDSVDLVHLRHMAGAFRDWRFIFEQAFECLKPGGYLEMEGIDNDTTMARFLATFPPGSTAHAIARDVHIGLAKSGRPRYMVQCDAKLWIEAGFVDITTTDHAVPITAELGTAGRLWLMTIVDGVEAQCLRPLTEYMGWDPEYAQKCCEELAMAIARFARDPEKRKGLATKITVMRGRKPTEEELERMEQKELEAEAIEVYHETGSNATSGNPTVGAEPNLSYETDVTMGETAHSKHELPKEGDSMEVDSAVETTDVMVESNIQGSSAQPVELPSTTAESKPEVQQPNEPDGSMGKGNTLEEPVGVARQETPALGSSSNDTQPEPFSAPDDAIQIDSEPLPPEEPSSERHEESIQPTPYASPPAGIQSQNPDVPELIKTSSLPEVEAPTPTTNTPELMSGGGERSGGEGKDSKQESVKCLKTVGS